MSMDLMKNSSTKLHVGNLHKYAKRKKLQAEFEKYGEVQECKVVKCKNYAFVQMASENEAKAALKNLNNTEFMGKKITVQVDVSMELAMSSTKIYVSNLPKNTKSDELLAQFVKYGKVKECEVVRHRNYAFVHMASENEAKVAIEKLNDSEFKETKISVQISHSTVCLQPGIGSKAPQKKRPRDIKRKKCPQSDKDCTSGAESYFVERMRPYPNPYEHRPLPPMSAPSQDSYYCRPYETAYGYTRQLQLPTQMQSSTDSYDFTQDPTFSS